ncbi:MAG: S41 family peptidase [Luteimonas sp.]
MHRCLLPFAIACLALAPLHAAEPPVAPPAAVEMDAQQSQAPAVEEAAADAAREGEADAASAPPAADGEQAPPAGEGGDAPPREDRDADAVDEPGEADAEQAPTAAAEEHDTPDSRVPLREIHRYVAVYTAVKEAYVDDVDDAELMQSAIRGLLLDLDPHSAYLAGEDARAFDESTTGAYAGIGVEVQRQSDGSMLVVAPIDETPAARAGIRSGDVIVAVDGEPLTPASHDGDGPLRGTPGTSVTMTVVRQDQPLPLEIEVVREEIRITSVRGRMLEPGYAYVRVSAFQVETAADFQRQVRELQEQGTLRGLVLDLRSNPGGLLTSAVQIADDLLDEGSIVSTRGRHPISETEFSATPGDLLDGAPVVVIVDAGSASASEVLAGALGEHDRARIIGSRTFGKGSVQTVLPLDNGDAVKLTTARYYTPSGRSIQARGIDPDVVLEPDTRPATLIDRSEAALPGHLHGDEEDLPGAGAGDVLPGDAPIDAALAELKSMQPGAAPVVPAQPEPAPVEPEPAQDDSTSPDPAASDEPR